MISSYVEVGTVESLYKEWESRSNIISPYAPYYYEQFVAKRFIQHPYGYVQVMRLKQQGDLYEVWHRDQFSSGSFYAESTQAIYAAVYESPLQDDIAVANAAYNNLQTLANVEQLRIAHAMYSKRLDQEFEGCVNGAGDSKLHYRADLRAILDETSFILEALRITDA